MTELTPPPQVRSPWAQPARESYRLLKRAERRRWADMNWHGDADKAKRTLAQALIEDVGPFGELGPIASWADRTLSYVATWEVVPA